MTRRAALEPYLGTRHTFTGEIAAFRQRYLLLWNVHQAGRFVTNHVWMRRGEFVPGWQFYLGDCIRFETEVYQYQRQRDGLLNYGLQFVSAPVRIRRASMQRIVQ